MLRVGDVERARPRPARAARARRGCELLDEQLNPVYLDAARIDREAVRAARRRRTTTSSTSASASGSTSSRASAARSSTRPSGSGRREGDRLFRERLGIGARRRAAVGRAAPLPRARSSTSLPVRPDAAGARGDARPTSGSTCARRRTSTSTSSSGRARARARSARRSRCRAG